MGREVGEPPTKRRREQIETDSLDHLFDIHLSSHSHDLYSEICGLQLQLSSQKGRKNSDEKTIPIVQDLFGSALSTSCHSLSLLSPKVCVQQLLEATKKDVDNAQGCPCLLTREQRAQVDVVMPFFKTLKEQFPSKWSEVISLLTKTCLPLEVLWKLHTDDILSLQAFLDGVLRDRKGCTYLTDQLIQLCTKPEENLSCKLLTVFVNSLALRAFPEKKSDDSALRKGSIGVLDGVTRGLLDEHMARTELLLHTCSWDNFPDNHTRFKKFCTHTISLIMSHQSNMKVSNALKRQTEWKSGKIPQNFKNLYGQLLLPFESPEVVEILRRILEKQEVNWQTLLSFLATFLVNFTTAATDIQEQIGKLLSEGLETGDMENTIVAFLLARQCCTEGPHVFPTYQDWFQQTFGNSSKSPAGSKKAFNFLTKFLTNLVPYEPADILKVHILRPPAVPAKCRDLWTDYILLAKTRLADLKVPLKEANTSIYTDQRNSETQADARLQDVEKAVAMFESLGKLPTTVLEASIFRRPYFVGKFLPALLLPRHLPDIPDSRMKFIEALWKAGKIPSVMHTKYEDACKMETKQLLEGVFDEEEEDSVEEMMRTPREQLIQCLKELSHVATSQSCENKISEIISILSEKIEAMLDPSVDAAGSCDQLCVIDLCQSDLLPSHIQLLDEVLNAVCRTWHSSQGAPHQSWLHQLARMLSKHVRLLPALFSRVLTLFHSNANLSQHHIEGLAGFVFHLENNSSLFPSISVKHGQGMKEEYVSFLPLFLHCLPTSTETEMKLALWFLASYLKIVFLALSTNHNDFINRTIVLPRQLIVLFCLLSWRTVPESLPRHWQSQPWRHLDTKDNEMAKKTEKDSVAGIVTALFGSEEFHSVLKDYQPTIEDWLEFELGVVTGMDVFSPLNRQSYRYTMLSHFIASQRPSGSLDSNVNSTQFVHCCCVLMQKLVRALTRCRTNAGECSKCGRLLQTSVSETAVKTEAVSELLTFLTKLVQSLPPSVCASDNRDTKGPWLPQQALHLVISSAQGRESAVPQAVLRVILSCPSYLLFTNCANEEPTHQSVTCTVQFLNEFMVQHAYKGIVSLDIICHLLEAYINACRNCSNRGALTLFEDHPLIILSTLVHWHHVCGLIFALPLVSSMWNRLSSYLSVMDRFFMDGNLCPVQASPDPFCLAAAMYASLVHRDWVCTPEVRKTLFSQLYTIQAKALGILSELMLVSMSDSHICSSSLPPETEICLLWLSEMWTLFPFLIGSTDRSGQSDLLTVAHSLISPDCLPFADIVCLRCVSMLSADRVAGEKGVVQVTVRLFAQLCQRFENPHTCKPSASMGVIVDLSQAVLNLVKTAPVTVLQALDCDNVKLCGLEISVAYQQRTKTRI